MKSAEFSHFSHVQETQLLQSVDFSSLMPDDNFRVCFLTYHKISWVHVAMAVYNFCEVVSLVGLSADHTMIAYMGGFHTNPNDCKESFQWATVQLFNHNGQAMKFKDVNDISYSVIPKIPMFKDMAQV
ncbi:hypothetical protein B0H14DRAFT_2645564 [Mycena olivaceomarginata]|nr:hypothetical protein B0H14DRAFT_2645564 [Mycena olivaceomarginata]